MKKLFILLALVLFVFAANAQRGRIKTLAVDTLKGNNNQTLATFNTSGDYSTIWIEVLPEKISTAAGGTLYLKGGISASGADVLNATTNPSIEFTTNDTLTIVDGAYWNINITEPGAYYWYIYGDGDVDDTVKVTTKYLLK